MGGSAQITRLRGTDAVDLDVKMMGAPNTPSADPLQLNEKSVLEGLIVVRINPAMILRLDLPLSAEGVVITNPGRYGARLGLRQGDVLQEINGKPVVNTVDVPKILEGSGRQVKMKLMRGGQQLNVRFRL